MNTSLESARKSFKFWLIAKLIEFVLALTAVYFAGYYLFSFVSLMYSLF